MATMPLVVSSGADLVNAAPADLFSGLDAGTDSTSDQGADAQPDIGESEIDTQEAPEVEQPEVEPQPETEELPEEESEKPEEAKPDEEELPEGVKRGKDRNGKPGFFLEENRYHNIYGNHQLVQKVSEMLGEPATAEALQLRHEAYLAQENLYGDLGAGDVTTQKNIVNTFLDEMKRARETGETGVDSSVPFGEAVYSQLKERSPDGYANLRMMAARDFIGEMFAEAAEKGNRDLFTSTQILARTLANADGIADVSQMRDIASRQKIPFFSLEEMPGMKPGAAKPDAAMRAELQRLQAIVDGRSTATQAEQFDAWQTATSKAVKTGVLDEVIKPALSSVEKSWEKFPDDYNDLVVDRLHKKVNEVLRSDEGFNARINQLDSLAKRAVSAQRRAEIGEEMKKVAVNRAKLAAEAVKKPILEFAANRLKQQADQRHERQASAQNRTAPKSATGTVPRSLIPKDFPAFKDGVYDPKTAAAQMKRLGL
jgi:hypothetical protein